jgi:hypothetical protein
MHNEFPFLTNLCIDLASPSFPRKVVPLVILPKCVDINNRKCSVAFLRDFDFQYLSPVVDEGDRKSVV